MMRDKRLDSLRGMAALFVLASHIGGALDERFLSLMLYRFDVGHVGVIAFFLISGRIISIKHGPRVFLIRRFFRIYPLYWISVLLIGGSLPIVLANLTMLPSLFGTDHINGGVWTLEVELAFYLSLILCRRLPPWMPAVGFALASLAFPWLFYLAVCWTGTQRRAIIPLLVLALTFTPHMLTYEPAHVLPRVAAFLLFALWRWQPRALVWIGERSYGLYLMHPLVIAHAPAVLWLPASLAVAALCYRYIERHAIGLGKRLTRRRLLSPSPEIP